MTTPFGHEYATSPHFAQPANFTLAVLKASCFPVSNQSYNNDNDDNNNVNNII